MNQAKWLSDFIYDVESTPLLWSVDDATQDIPQPNSMKLQSFPKLPVQSIKDATIPRDKKLCNNEIQQTAFQLESERSLIFSDVAKETSLAKENASHGKEIHSSYLDLSIGSTSELSNNNYEEERDNINTTADDFCTKAASRACPRGNTEHDLSDMVLIDASTPTAPTYLEVQSRDFEKSRLLREVKKYPSYLAIASPDEENAIQKKSCAEPNTQIVGTKIDTLKNRLRDTTEDVGYRNEKVFRRKYSSSSSDAETVDDMEYLSGGIWYSDEEEELAIRRLCDFENPNIVSSESDDESNTKTEISSFSHQKYKHRTSKVYPKNVTKHNRPTSHEGTAVKKLRDKCHSSKSISKELSDDFDESDDDTFNIVSAGQLADIVPFDDVVSLIEDCHSEREHEERSRSCSESDTSTPSCLLTPSTQSAASSRELTIESGCDLEWDTYMPPLSIQCSDVMIKQIFDSVEKDNEKYVRQLRRMTQRQDTRPLNILQRLYWYDECSGSLQSLVGVFEYNL